MTNFFYYLKPLIPRRIQILVRKQLVLQKRVKYNHIWPITEKAGKQPDGWSGWPGQKRSALVLTHDVDTAAGYNKCYELMKIEEKLGFRSSFNFVPERYNVSRILLDKLVNNGFEVGVHGLKHDGKLYSSKKIFKERALRINYYLKNWQAVGFRSPAMHHNLEWLHDLNIEYDASTFDVDPFEPQPDGVGTIFPFWVSANHNSDGYMELPYTLPQDHLLFILMQEKDIKIWQRKLAWIIEKGGMALLVTHPDYMNFSGKRPGLEEYPAKFYWQFLEYIKTKYEGLFWHALPRDIARWAHHNIINKNLIMSGWV